MAFEFEFISIASSEDRRVRSCVHIGDPVRLKEPLTGFGAQVSVRGPEDFSLQAKGAHALQALEVALFIARTVLSTNSARWAYEDETGGALDFSYEWPRQQR